MVNALCHSLMIASQTDQDPKITGFFLSNLYLPSPQKIAFMEKNNRAPPKLECQSGERNRHRNRVS